MSDPLSDSTRTSAPDARRGAGRFTTALAALALATAVYSLARLDSTRDRVDQVKDTARAVEATTQVLRAELHSLGKREEEARHELQQQLQQLSQVPAQLQDVAAALEELRGRAEGPERAWSRAEARFLLELAQRRLALEHDLTTAIVALESADARLANLKDPGVAAVRQEIARELQVLRAVPATDRTGLLARLNSAEERASQLSVKGILATQRTKKQRIELPEGAFRRAFAVLRSAIRDLVTVRRVDEQSARIITAQEQQLRRQHLQLLLFAAAQAVVRHDGAAYRNSLFSARQWLHEHFDVSDPATAAFLKELHALEPLEVAPELPDISGSLRLLQRLPAGRAPA